MKTIKIISGITLSVLLISSCVSTKKYQASLDSKDALITEKNRVELERDSLVVKLEKQKIEASKLLSEKEKEIDSKEESIEEREERLRELEVLIQDQKNASEALHQEVCSALKCFTPEELSVEVRAGKLYVSLSDKLLFESGSEAVNERGKDAIVMLGEVLSNSELEIRVEGHTDSIPIKTAKYKDNWDLSAHRATNVTRILVKNGITSSRIIASGRGEYQPLVSNETEKGRQLNRRTEIVLSPKLDKLWDLTQEKELIVEQ